MNRIGERSEERKSALVVSTASSCSPTAYLPPRIIQLGKSKHLIRGDQASNYADNTHDFYWSGE